LGSFLVALHTIDLCLLSSRQSLPLLVPTYDRPIDRPYDRRQTYKDPTYVHFSRAFRAIDDDNGRNRRRRRPIRKWTIDLWQRRFL